MTVAKLSETVKIPTEKAVANLEKQGIKVAQPTMTVQQIADENKLTPQQVYQKIQSEDAKPKVSLAEGGGWGRMNVQQVCERFNVPLDAGVARLQAAGIEATASTAIRELATSRGKTPIDIAKIIVGEDGTVPSPAEHKPGAGPGPGDEVGKARRRPASLLTPEPQRRILEREHAPSRSPHAPGARRSGWRTHPPVAPARRAPSWAKSQRQPHRPNPCSHPEGGSAYDRARRTEGPGLRRPGLLPRRVHQRQALGLPGQVGPPLLLPR